MEPTLIRIDLTADGESFGASQPVHAQGNLLTVGASPRADIALPRARFIEFAQTELQLGYRGGVFLLRHCGIERCSVDGTALPRAAELTLAPGVHQLSIGSRLFSLKLVAL